jgi:hypothetical protein
MVPTGEDSGVGEGTPEREVRGEVSSENASTFHPCAHLTDTNAVSSVEF